MASIFSISPPQNVNRGLAENWESPLPQQIDLIKFAAGLKQQRDQFEARMKEERIKRRNDEYQGIIDNIDLTGLHTEQVQEIHGKVTIGQICTWGMIKKIIILWANPISGEE